MMSVVTVCFGHEKPEFSGCVYKHDLKTMIRELDADFRGKGLYMTQNISYKENGCKARDIFWGNACNERMYHLAIAY